MKRLILILLFVIALVNVSCERRELVDIANTHYVRVYINEDIKNVTTGFHENAQVRPTYKSPEILHLLLADPQTGKLKAERFLRTKKQDEKGTYYEGYIVATPGQYDLIAYNWGTEVCIVSNYMDFNTSMVYTNEIAAHDRNGLSSDAMSAVKNAMEKVMQKMMQRQMMTKGDEDSQTDKIVYDPDQFFLANCGRVDVSYSSDIDTLRTPAGEYFMAESIVKSYYLQIPVIGIENHASLVGVLSGMAGSTWLGRSELNEQDPVAIYLELQQGGDNPTGVVKSKEEPDASAENDASDVVLDAAEGSSSGAVTMYTTFSTFGRLTDPETSFSLTFDFQILGGGVFTQTVDITEEFNSQLAKEKQWIILGMDKKIIVPDPQPGAGSGGFAPSVGGWEDIETDIIL